MRSLAQKKQSPLGVGSSSVHSSHAPDHGIESPYSDTYSIETGSIETNAVEALISHLADLGVEQSFGVSGGAIAMFFDAMENSAIELRHFRHETGAAFAAAEASLATGRPAVAFATTGPGLLNALTGMTAARWDGATVILISGATGSSQRGRWATQETSSYTMPQDALYTSNAIFDFAVRVEHASELAVVTRRLSQGVRRPGGFVAHISLPMSVQSARIQLPKNREHRVAQPSVSSADIKDVARRLAGSSFAIWAGFGATKSAAKVRALSERTGAPVFCSPRAKGVMPEDHPLYLGVTGLGGHDTVTDYMFEQRPDTILVLGSRLGEATSFWDRDMVPSGGFIHVDINPDVPGVAYPDTQTTGIHAEIGCFLDQLLDAVPGRAQTVRNHPHRLQEMPVSLVARSDRRPVRPQVVMQTLQRRVVQESSATVLAECGNSFAWCNHYLRFSTPGRYRVSTLFGSMGHAAAGVVGAALATGDKAVAVVGDGSMLMNSEISSAVQYGAKAVWVVLNDAGYGMCRDGHRALGLTKEQVDIPQVDFCRLARSMGADGATVSSEDELGWALDQAMTAPGPFVIDVRIDPSEASPLLKRFESLIKQGSSKNVAGWET